MVFVNKGRVSNWKNKLERRGCYTGYSKRKVEGTDYCRQLQIVNIQHTLEGKKWKRQDNKSFKW